MRNGFIVVAIVGLLAITVGLLLKQPARRAAPKARDIQRWEDDGGHLPEVDYPAADTRHAVVSVDVQSA